MRIPALSRMARLSAIPLGAGRRAAVAGGLRALGRLTDEKSLDLHERTADQLFEVLGELRGGVMKFGQVLSVYETVLPPSISAVYRDRLAGLQEAARPENAARIRQVLEDDLGPGWEEGFASLDPEPVAVASLGQVHRAVLPDGRPAAVKVQYPDARAQLLDDRDLTVFAMRWFTFLIAPELDGRALAAELMDGLAGELDYAREAGAQTAFRAGFLDDSDYVVPEVIRQEGRVLVSEWVGGTPLSRIIAAGSEERRNRAGLLLTRLMFSGIPRTGMMHGDPHPGNFRLLDDGRLAVLDFGAMYRHQPGTTSPLHQWMLIHLAEDPDELVAVLRDLGFLRPGVRADGAKLKALFEHSGTAVQSETFRFDAAFLRATVEGMTSSMPVGLSLAFPPGYVHAQRALGVGIGVLCQLDAEVPFLLEALHWLGDGRAGAGPGGDRGGDGGLARR